MWASRGSSHIQSCFVPSVAQSEEMESQAASVSFAQLSPDTLIQKCVEGGVAAWEEFMRRYHRLIAGVVFRTTQKWGESSPTTMDDLIQETYLKLCADEYRLLRAYDPKHSDAIYGYLKVITANVVHDRFKALHSEKRGGDHIAEDLTEVANRTDTGKAFGSQEAMERDILLREIDALLNANASANTADRDRTIFWLYYRQGLTTKAIASLPAIGLTIKGVESTISRLTKLIRRRMVEIQPDG
jgi:RNA polymerase sigma-70 factor (ECF subfamily)